MENFDSSGTSQLNDLISKFSPYFYEIRKRLFFTLTFFVVATVSGFIFYEKIIRLLINVLSLNGINIVFTSPFQFINLAVSCGIATGLVLVFPILIYQILSFLRPALRKKEYYLLIRFLPFSIILFLAGFSFGVLVMKWQIQLFLEKSIELGIGNVLDISRLISTVLIVSTVMGISFQFPILILLLTRLRIIKHNQLARLRWWVYFGALIFTFLLPLDSLLADAIFTLPILILFELTLLLTRALERRKVG